MTLPRRSFVLVIALGLLARFVVLGIAPRYGYPWDHFDNIGMGRTAASAGLLRAYSVSKEDLAIVHGQTWRNGALEAIDRRAMIAPNYPPLAITVFLAQTSVLALVQGRLTANTFGARTVMASIPIALEWITAVAAGAIAARLFGERRRRLAQGLTWLFPPIFLNSCLWGQVDAFFLAPAVLTVLFLLDRRWAAAGITAAAAALLKPQGLLLAPIMLFGAVIGVDDAPRIDASRVARRLLTIFGSALAVVAILTAPWMVVDGIAWVRRSYIVSFLTAFPDTTLYAFNIWYADLLRLDSRPLFALDSTARVLGVTKDMWGRVLFGIASAGIAILCWKKVRPRSVSLVYFTALFLWGAFMFPTRVHERFILYGIPFVLILSVGFRSLRPALLALLIVGTAEQTWNLWMKGPPAGALMNRRQVESRLAKLQADYDQTSAESSVQGIRKRPARADAVASLAGEARTVLPSYVRTRRALRPWEILFTALSIAAYLAAILGWPRTGIPHKKTRR